MSRVRSLVSKQPYRSILPLLLLIVLAVTPAAFSQGFGRQPTRTLVGLKVGLISRGDLKADRTYQTKIGPSGGVFFDAPVPGKFFVGAAFDFHGIGLVNNQQVMIDVNVTVKRSFRIRRAAMVLKPGVAVGYAYLAEVNFLEASDYLSLKLFFESYFRIDRKKSWVAEIGIFWAPTGGNDEFRVTFGPAIILRGGIVFK